VLALGLLGTFFFFHFLPRVLEKFFPSFRRYFGGTNVTSFFSVQCDTHLTRIFPGRLSPNLADFFEVAPSSSINRVKADVFLISVLEQLGERAGALVGVVPRSQFVYGPAFLFMCQRGRALLVYPPIPSFYSGAGSDLLYLFVLRALL